MRIYASFVSLFSYLYVSFFFLAAFKILFYILSFIHLTLMFLGVVYSVFILLGFGWSSWFCVLECFHQIRRVWDHFFFFPSALSLKFYWEHQLSVFYYCCLRNQWDFIQWFLCFFSSQWVTIYCSISEHWPLYCHI